MYRRSPMRIRVDSVYTEARRAGVQKFTSATEPAVTN